MSLRSISLFTLAFGLASLQTTWAQPTAVATEFVQAKVASTYETIAKGERVEVIGAALNDPVGAQMVVRFELDTGQAVNGIVFRRPFELNAEAMELLGSTRPAGAERQPVNQGRFKLDGFRDHDWGTSRRSVRAKEGRPEETLGDDDLYSATVGGLRADVGFRYTDGKLSGGAYMFDEQHGAAASHIDDYEKVGAILREQYGSPAVRDRIWLNDLFRDDPSDHGTALQLGHYKLQDAWVLEGGFIIHTLSAGDSGIMHSLVYRSEEGQAHEAREAERANARDF